LIEKIHIGTATKVPSRFVCAGEIAARFGTVAGVLLSGLIVSALAASTAAQPPKKRAPTTSGAPTYSRDVRPILQARCVVCHSSGNASNPAVSGGLALDSYAAIKQGAAGRKTDLVLTAGKSADSTLYKRLVATSLSKLMPKGGPALPVTQIELIKRWIDSGAPEGSATKEPAAAKASPESLPMPANRTAIDVSVPTRIQLPVGVLGKGKAGPGVSLKVGPLPPVAALACSPDGKRLAIGAYRAVAIWDTATGRPVTCITHFSGAVLALSFRPDGNLLAVGTGVPGASGEVRVFDTKGWSEAGKPLGGHADVVASVCWSADGTRIASGSQDKSAHVWEWPSEKELRVFKDHSDGVSGVCFSPDGKSLYTASLDHNARRFDIEKGGLIRLFTGHNDAITALAISPDGKRLVTAGGEPNVRWWNVETGDTTNNNGGHGGAVAELTFAKDGTLLVSASADKTLRLWDGANTQQKRALEGSSDWLFAAAITPDDRLAFGAGADGVVRAWETGTGRLRLSLIFWPPAKDGSAFDWIVITPEGFYDGSAGWTGKLRLDSGVKPADVQKFQGQLRSLIQPQNVLKAWQGTSLDPAKAEAK